MTKQTDNAHSPSKLIGLTTEGLVAETPAFGLPEMLTITEVATFLRCSRVHVQNLVCGSVAGVPPLPFVPLGRRKLVRRGSLMLWLEKVEAKAGFRC